MDVDPDDLSTAHLEAQVALLRRIKELTEATPSNWGSRSETVSKLALAYRYLSGGPQPGVSSVSVTK